MYYVEVTTVNIWVFISPRLKNVNSNDNNNAITTANIY